MLREQIGYSLKITVVSNIIPNINSGFCILPKKINLFSERERIQFYLMRELEHKGLFNVLMRAHLDIL